MAVVAEAIVKWNRGEERNGWKEEENWKSQDRLLESQRVTFLEK